jgi:Mycothiol maleylpyruvate isomerase N-terminal domain
MAEKSERERLSAREAAGWDELVTVLDRIPPSEAESPGMSADGWTTKDVVFHLAAWADAAAAELAAMREGRYEPSGGDTDARNDEYLRAGRGIDMHAARTRLERARGRALAEWSAMRELSAPAVEWFAESGAEHYHEHLDQLRTLADRVTGDGRPGASARRAAILAAEGEGWAELDAVIASMDEETLERPGVTPDGWTVKDTMWHVAKWWEDFVDAVPRFADPAFDPDDETAEQVDALNRAWFDESRALSLDVVRERWRASRDAGVTAFRAMADPPRTAEEWFVECGLTHYEKHLIDLRPWARQAARLPGRGDEPQ